MCGFDGIRRRAKVEVRVCKLKNGKATGKVEIAGEMIKGGGVTKHKRKNVVYASFINLEKAYDKVNRPTLASAENV